MEQLANTTFDYKYYMTADNNVMRRADFYHEIQQAGFTLDVRKFKGKKAYCPNKLCNMSKTGFDLQVQAEVDVAIVMKAMEHLCMGQLSNLTLLAGDGDFRDLCSFITTKANKKV